MLFLGDACSKDCRPFPLSHSYTDHLSGLELSLSLQLFECLVANLFHGRKVIVYLLELPHLLSAIERQMSISRAINMSNQHAQVRRQVNH